MHVPLDKAKIIEFFLYTTMGKEKTVKLIASLYNSMFYNMWTFIFPKWIKRRKKREKGLSSKVTTHKMVYLEIK